MVITNRNSYPNLNNLYTNVQNNMYNFVQTSNSQNPANISTNESAKPTVTDKKGKIKKALGITSAAGAALLAAVYGGKKIQVRNIKNIQKAFSEVFMRDDITLEHTREMLKRYKEIEKIKDCKEYVKALFEEVKKNFGMEKSNIELILEDLEHQKARGFCSCDNSYIKISTKCNRANILNTMHHEFRHAKQHELVVIEHPECAAAFVASVHSKEIDKLVDAFIDTAKETKNGIIVEGKEYTQKEFERLIMKKVRLPFVENCIEKYFGYISSKTVPEKYKEFVEKCKEGCLNYVDGIKDFKKYWTNYTEIDARHIGRTMNKYIKGHAFEPVKDGLLRKFYEQCSISAFKSAWENVFGKS